MNMLCTYYIMQTMASVVADNKQQCIKESTNYQGNEQDFDVSSEDPSCKISKRINSFATYLYSSYIIII